MTSGENKRRRILGFGVDRAPIYLLLGSPRERHATGDHFVDPAPKDQ